MQPQLAGQGCPRPVAGRGAARRGGGDVNWQVRVAHAPSPDVRYGHPALRSLGCRRRCAILAALVCIRRLSGHGQPRPDKGQEVPEAASTLRHAAGKARAACHPARPASTRIRGDEAAITQGPHVIGRPDGGRRAAKHAGARDGPAGAKTAGPAGDTIKSANRRMARGRRPASGAWAAREPRSSADRPTGSTRRCCRSRSRDRSG
jgi:hypothetical protein